MSYSRLGDGIAALFEVMVPLAIIGALTVLGVVGYGFYWVAQHVHVMVYP